MIDEAKRKKLIYASIIFAVLVVCAIIGFFVFSNREDLPPVEPETDNTSEQTETKPVPPVLESTDKTESTTLVRNDLTYEKFALLRQYAITDVRIDVILYFLGEYAATQSTGTITTFTFDESSMRQTKDGEKHIFTFTTKDNLGNTYKVELSYTYSTEADVHIYDANNNLVQSTPTENHPH